MLLSLAQAAQALVAWRIYESGDTDELSNPADRKAAAAHAHQLFITAAFGVAFDLVPYLLAHGQEVATINEVRYCATPEGGGLIILKMNLDPANPGTLLTPDTAGTEHFMQLICDLPELIDVLKIKES
jgi:hypothetical protein